MSHRLIVVLPFLWSVEPFFLVVTFLLVGWSHCSNSHHFGCTDFYVAWTNAIMPCCFLFVPCHTGWLLFQFFCLLEPFFSCCSFSSCLLEQLQQWLFYPFLFARAFFPSCCSFSPLFAWAAAPTLFAWAAVAMVSTLAVQLFYVAYQMPPCHKGWLLIF